MKFSFAKQKCCHISAHKHVFMRSSTRSVKYHIARGPVTALQPLDLEKKLKTNPFGVLFVWSFQFINLNKTMQKRFTNTKFQHNIGTVNVNER